MVLSCVYLAKFLLKFQCVLLKFLCWNTQERQKILEWSVIAFDVLIGSLGASNRRS
jgi:hypothetical protein